VTVAWHPPSHGAPAAVLNGVAGVFKLRGRISAAMIGISVLSLAVAAVSLLIPLRGQLRRDALASLVQTTRTARPTFDDLPHAAFRPDSPRLGAAALALARRTHAEVLVVDTRGRVLVATGGGPFPAISEAQREHRLVRGIVSVGDASEARVALPLEGSGRGNVLGLRKSLGDQTAAERVVRRALPLAAAIALTAALLVAILVAGGLVRRLASLRDTTLRLADVGLEAEIRPDDARDEVGDLTRAFATMQGRLRDQEQARRTFVSTASHELRTPLTSLRLILESALDDLQRERPDVEDARDQLTRAVAQTDRLSRLSGQLLNLSRLDAALPVRAEALELGELARSVLAEFEPHAAHGGPRLVLDAPDACWVTADPGAVAQILRILLDNALRHAPGGSEVRVVAREGGHVTVADEGPGVPDDERDEIFDRFRRGSTTAAGDGGFGLGLAIGRELARRMGGELDLAPPGGSGACFRLTLPGA
jgi:signal transduction histidine kinase